MDFKEIKQRFFSGNIGFFTGAGISTNCGLPDFRGEGGLYSFAKERYNLPYAEAIFDIEYFKSEPKPFFLLSKELINSGVTPSYAHKFISELEKKKLVEIIVTQNIDMLHEKAGSSKIINCHGTYETATCRGCLKSFTFDEIKERLYEGEIPLCSCGGVIKPDITFFGESLPEEFYNILLNPPKLNSMIVVGTSLTVEPAASFPKSYFGRCPTLLINRDSTPYDDYFDLVINSDIDEFFEGVKSEF